MTIDQQGGPGRRRTPVGRVAVGVGTAGALFPGGVKATGRRPGLPGPSAPARPRDRRRAGAVTAR
ncbi:hypothetical protein ABTX81_31730 [Kitasatospora sp. NPDC097605]|uniref:hypothetical protein n=1 Tax=Kitasatospora sp. NPDC097605 TaxID=3157226 RepID=UPI00331682D2